jgi:quercetin dioxygenase-like cupin family protein
MRVIHVTLGLLIFATSVPAFAQGGHEGMVTGPDNLKWGPAPPELSGAQIAVLYGDPSKEGPFVLRLKLPSNYQIPAHHHSMAESVTVISGDFYAGMGDKLDRNGAQLFRPGGFAWIPANTNHYAWAGNETVVQVQGQGPFDLVLANPENARSK